MVDTRNTSIPAQGAALTDSKSLIPMQGAALTGFKNVNGLWILKPIFFELDTGDHLFSVYSLKNEDHTVNGVLYPSIRRLYMELSDPTEYSFCTTYLGGWPHWKRMLESPAILEYVLEWREELEVKLRSQALARIKTRAVSGSKDALTADRLLLSGGWKAEKKSDVGRPTKQKIKEEADRLFSAKSEVDDDYDRIFGAKLN